MIPAGLAATQVAFTAWKAGIGTVGPNSLAALDDDDLGAIYQALAALLRDVEAAHGDARALLLKRILAKGSGPVTAERTNGR